MKYKATMLGLLLILLLNPALPIEAKIDKKQKCLETKEKIIKINRKMRQKYTVKQGEKYRRQLEKLYKLEFKYCF
ncbi:hypothetical protein [Photobacterium lipolyticum]|uniref:DUF1090 domain-containing protein n=1 Tax=Photobacterium lipolyticum TaxID=266810 RepID=A0A2T3MZK9_9GAMM|nr:hypothetical protein [Photobacterium lipolyticum]PSW05356.1 hypothetical protein C9I89_08835 [Photobacterium lipolyticum]